MQWRWKRWHCIYGNPTNTCGGNQNGHWLCTIHIIQCLLTKDSFCFFPLLQTMAGINYCRFKEGFLFWISYCYKSYGWIRLGGENKIPLDSQWDVFGSLTHRPEQMGTALWDGVNLAQIHIQSLQKNIPLNPQQTFLLNFPTEVLTQVTRYPAFFLGRFIGHKNGDRFFWIVNLRLGWGAILHSSDHVRKAFLSKRVIHRSVS